MIKKLSPLLIIPFAAFAHYLLREEAIFLVVIWGLTIAFIIHKLRSNFDPNYLKAINNFANADCDVDIHANITQKRFYIEQIGEKTTAKITMVSKERMGPSNNPVLPDCYVIEYEYFDESGNKFIGLKGIYDTIHEFHPSIPTIGDKIAILYDKSHPEESVIVHTKADKVPWYKLQKKYKVIINPERER